VSNVPLKATIMQEKKNSQLFFLKTPLNHASSSFTQVNTFSLQKFYKKGKKKREQDDLKKIKAVFCSLDLTLNDAVLRSSNKRKIHQNDVLPISSADTRYP